MAKDVVLTGLRSNAEFHLGNYLGAMLPMVKLQQKHAGDYQINMFLPDLHSIITPIEHGKLYEQTHQNLKVFVAAGLDIDQPNTFIYRQSYIPAHSELTWILDCFTYFGELNRMTEFKDKVRNLRDSFADGLEPFGNIGGMSAEELNKTDKLLEPIKDANISVGLFNYPALMACDILLYGAKYVPVGEDQRQHIEYTRDIAMRMNKRFGDLFVVPANNAEQLKFSGRDEPVRVRSLRNPEKKMSKSVDDPAGTIMLSDKPEDAVKKVMSATTDNEAKVGKPDFESRPGVANLFQIYKLLGGEADCSEMSYKEFKESVAKTVSDFLSDLQSKLAEVDEQKLMKKLEDDEAAMRKVADATLLKVQKAVGLRPND